MCFPWPAMLSPKILVRSLTSMRYMDWASDMHIPRKRSCLFHVSEKRSGPWCDEIKESRTLTAWPAPLFSMKLVWPVSGCQSPKPSIEWDVTMSDIETHPDDERSNLCSRHLDNLSPSNHLYFFLKSGRCGSGWKRQSIFGERSLRKVRLSNIQKSIRDDVMRSRWYRGCWIRRSHRIWSGRFFLMRQCYLCRKLWHSRMHCTLVGQLERHPFTRAHKISGM
jgi:hypothetical protein